MRSSLAGPWAITSSELFHVNNPSSVTPPPAQSTPAASFDAFATKIHPSSGDRAKKQLLRFNVCLACRSTRMVRAYTFQPILYVHSCRVHLRTHSTCFFCFSVLCYSRQNFLFRLRNTYFTLSSSLFSFRMFVGLE